MITLIFALSLFFKDPEYSYQALRTVSVAQTQAADIGECMVTSSAITEGDDETWFKEWHKLAQRTERDARKYKYNEDMASARSAFRRASNYYRTCEFFLHSDPHDPRIQENWKKSKDCFLEAVRDYPIIQVEIPFEDTTLPGYLCLVDRTDKVRPLLLLQSGFDGTKEELFFSTGEAALRRGYNCLIFEGPGQGEVIRREKIPF